MSSSPPSPKPDEPTPPRSTGPTSSPPPPAPSPGSPGAAPRSTTPADRNGPTSPGGPVAAPGKRDEKTAEEPRPTPRTAEYLAKTRAAAAWFFTAVALVVMVLLIILILQNQDHVEVSYLGLEARLPLGVALLIAAVVGAALVTIVGVIRLTQLRRHAKRVQRLEAEQRKR